MGTSRVGLATATLLSVTALWGSTFIVVKDAVALLDAGDFLVWRFGIASALLVAIFWRRLIKQTWKQWGIGIILGLLYGAAQVFQTLGLQYTTASAAGFITSTYVVITPLIMWAVFRVRPGLGLGVAVALAVVGLAILSLSGPTGVGIGEVLMLACAALYAIHIVVLDRVVRRLDSFAATTTQMLGITLACAVYGLPGGMVMPPNGSVWFAIVFTAVMASAVTLFAQTWAQQYIPPTRAALLMTFEPVFATIFAVILGGEQVTLRFALGGLLILCATVIGARSDGVPRESDPSALDARTLGEAPSV